jgi:hypothetical protein
VTALLSIEKIKNCSFGKRDFNTFYCKELHGLSIAAAGLKMYQLRRFKNAANSPV